MLKYLWLPGGIPQHHFALPFDAERKYAAAVRIQIRTKLLVSGDTGRRIFSLEVGVQSISSHE
jgi:hypothetical protein